MAQKIDELLTMEMFKASQMNEVRIGGTVESKSVAEGQQKRDKEGQLIYNDQTGLPICWNDSYYVEFSFKGGLTNFKVEPKVHEELEIGTTYQFIGRAFMKTPYGDGKPYLSIELVRFDKLF